MSSSAAFSAAVLMLVAYLLLVERRRIGATSLALAGFIILYGAGFWYFSYDAAHLVSSVVERAQYVLALGFMSFLAGAEVVRWSIARHLHEQRSLERSWSGLPLGGDDRVDHWLFLLGLMVAGYVLLVMLATGKFASIGSFFTLASEEARAELRKYGESGGYLYALLISSFGPFLSAVLLLRAMASRRRAMWGVALLLMAAILLARFALLTKSMWVVYLAQLGLTIYVVKSLELPLLRALGAVLLLVAALFLGSWLAFPEAPAGEIAQYLLYRIVQITNEVTYQTLYAYPDYLPHTEGLNIGMLGAISGYDIPAPAHTAVANLFGAGGATFNSMFMGGAWVDFGWAGVAGVSFVVGVCVRLYDHLMMSVGKTALGCALAGFAVIPIDQLMATSAQTAMLTGGLVSIPLLIILLWPLGRPISGWPLRRGGAPQVTHA